MPHLDIQRIRRSAVAILAGFLADTLGTILVLGAVFLAYGISVGQEGADQVNRLAAWLPFQVFEFALGVFYTGFGGFVAARMVEERRMLHAIAVAALSTLLALLTDRSTTLAWPLYLGCALSFPAAVVGATVAERKKAQR